MKPEHVLDGAAALIAKHGHTQHVNARDADGIPVAPCHPTAMARDMTGALLAGGKMASGGVWVLALRALGEAVGIAGYETVGNWKYSPSHARDLCEQMWEWEDRPGRTPEHVLDAFARATRIVRGDDIHDSDQEAVQTARRDRSSEPIG